MEKFIETYGTNDVKKEESLTRYYDVIDLDQEYSLLRNADFIRKQVSFIEGKMMLAGDPVSIRVSKRGSIYFVIKNQIARGLVRSILLEKLIKYKYVLEKEPVAELPQYWIYKAYNKKFKLLVYINKKSNLYSLIYDYDYGIELLKKQQVKINYNRLREEPDTHQSGSKVWLKDPDEVYGSLAPEMFNEKVEELEEALNLLLELKQRRCSTEEIELLKEIKSELEIIL